MHKDLEQWYSKGSYLKHRNGELKVFYVNFGSDHTETEDTLLILHGFPESSFSFHKVIDKLLSRFKRIVLFDFIGFGFSDKPRINYNYSILDHADLALNIWQQLNIKGGHLLAHDMGTSVATELHSRLVGNEKQFSLSKGFHSISFTNGSMVIKYADLRIAQKLLLKPRLGPIFSSLLNYPLFTHQIKSAHGNEKLSRDDLQCLWDQVNFNKGNRISHLLIKYYLDRIKYEQNRWLEDLKHTELPINIIWGTDDKVARVEMAEYLKNAVVKDAKLIKMKGLGHFGQIASPQQWSEQVLSIKF